MTYKFLVCNLLEKCGRQVKNLFSPLDTLVFVSTEDLLEAARIKYKGTSAVKIGNEIVIFSPDGKTGQTLRLRKRQKPAVQENQQPRIPRRSAP